MSTNKLPASVTAGLEPLSRRSFLKAGLVAGTAASALIASGCASLTGSAPMAGRKPLEIKHLSQSEYEVFDRLVRVLLPTENDPDLPSSIREVPVLQNIDDMVGPMPADVRKLLALGVDAFDKGAVVLSFRFKRFAALNDEQARKYVDSWQEGTFFQRGLMTTMKSLVTLNYWKDERTWGALDYDGPVTEKWGIRRLGNAPLPRV